MTPPEDRAFHGLTSKGARRREAIIEAAAAILRQSGPQQVTHRTVAQRAGCSLSATTYYFDGMEELLTEAARRNIRTWASRAEGVAAQMTHETMPAGIEERAAILLRACLPPDESLEAHYLQLINASQSPLVTAAYQQGRHHLDAAVGHLLALMGLRLRASHLIALVDGAAVAALSEGLPIRETAGRLVEELLEDFGDFAG